MEAHSPAEYDGVVCGKEGFPSFHPRAVDGGRLYRCETVELGRFGWVNWEGKHDTHPSDLTVVGSSFFEYFFNYECFLNQFINS